MTIGRLHHFHVLIALSRNLLVQTALRQVSARESLAILSIISSPCSVTARRKVIAPFTFSDGLTVARGDWVCAATRPSMNDPKAYPCPEAFDGFRFLRDEGSASSKFTDVSDEWVFWGRGRLLWFVPFELFDGKHGTKASICNSPGRFYASLVTKLVLANFLQNYEFELENDRAPLCTTWRTTKIPLDNTILLIKPKSVAQDSR